MANQKEIRKRISTVKSTQKITRAMKMVAGARLHRAQARIAALRPFAQETAKVLDKVVHSAQKDDQDTEKHPFLAEREEKRVLLLVVTSDRGLCGAFNSNILRRAEQARTEFEAAGKTVVLHTIGRKARDFFQRRRIKIDEQFPNVWDNLDVETARRVARTILGPFYRGEVDSIYLVYNEFKSAMTQAVVLQRLLPVAAGENLSETQGDSGEDFLYEPDRDTLLSVLVPVYIETTILRCLYESMASELGARMTAMDSATKNASDMISDLTLKYNRARQAAITTELMEIIGGSEALNA
ncbi:MAG: F0F1 ATP synthase subunit gamma [Sorangiineae bacterium NIC37A_2]|nr:MAG: F0F1 ATP synthase subunit gamma [Sorangiineae bacterium NIC37A_2]